jgi:hypothetical protein
MCAKTDFSEGNSLESVCLRVIHCIQDPFVQNSQNESLSSLSQKHLDPTGGISSVPRFMELESGEFVTSQRERGLFLRRAGCGLL